MNETKRTPLPKIPYDAQKIRLSRIYENPVLDSYDPVCSNEKIESIYGPLCFPEPPEDRPYLIASMVTSLDGKIAFEDDPEGPLIAQLNRFDPDGGAADFWVLNMLRSVCDGSMGMGGPSETKKHSTSSDMFGVDLEGGCHVFDQDLEDHRISCGQPAVPWTIITSLDCSEIGFGNPAVNNHPLIPMMITTSPDGLDRIRSRSTARYQVIEDPAAACLPGPGIMPVIVTGAGSMPDAKDTMSILRKMGLKRILIEGPSYTHHLLREGMLDELFLNYSCIYVGGKALSLGMRGDSFPSGKHPHTQMLSIHTHGPHFFYLRHKLMY